MNARLLPENLHKVARIAVADFLREEVSLRLLGHGQSLAYRVRAASGEYLLRVHSPLLPPARPAFFQVQAIESECNWLRAIGAETELLVQQPVQTSAGNYVLQVPCEQLGKPVACTLLTWVTGQHLTERRTKQQAAQLGELLAALHSHARQWKRPANFERPTHDRNSWRDALARFDHLVTIGGASSEDRDLLTRAVEQADQELAPLMLRPERIGLIHADLHGGNYVFQDGCPRPIDFGLAGFGPWLWDLAECLGHLGPARRRDLVDAYARHHSLEEIDVRRIEGYLLASLVEVFGYNAHDPSEQDYLERAVPAWAPHFKRYTNGEPFLFEL